MKKYGLQLRVPLSQPKKSTVRPAVPLPVGFRDDEDDDIEMEISRQASKNKSLKDIEEQHKKALAEDPSVFDYDGVYDEMKEQVALPKAQDQQERKPKYIQALLKKAEERQREQDVIYERKLAKERSKDDHLFSDKDKFVTSAYKKKLVEQAKWLEEDRLRQLKEEKDDVTKKTDLSDFYFNLERNVAFGGKSNDRRKPDDRHNSETEIDENSVGTSDRGCSMVDTSLDPSSSVKGSKPSSPEGMVEDESLLEKQMKQEASPAKMILETPNVDGAGINSEPNKDSVEQVTEKPDPDHHRRNEAALTSAKERFLARKKAKLQ